MPLQQYCRRVLSPSFWGGESEALVLVTLLKRPIAVYMPVGPNREWPDGFRRVATYGTQYGKAASGAARRPVRLLFNGQNHYDLLLPEFA
jgi:hypothetical protein